MSLTKVAMPERDPKERSTNFEEVAMGYTERDGFGRSCPLLELQKYALRFRMPGQCQNTGIYCAESRKANLLKLMKKLKRPIVCRLFAVEYALRKISAKENA